MKMLFVSIVDVFTQKIVYKLIVICRKPKGIN